MNRISRKILAGMALVLGLALPSAASAGEAVVGVLLSREIAPYVAMVEGLESATNLGVQRFFLDENGRPFSLGEVGATLDRPQYKVLVAVGPEALDYLNHRSASTPLVFGMVLNPRALVADHDWRPCGVDLAIPAAAQFSAILAHLPALKRLGILFDPANNQDWFNHAADEAAALGLELVPLQISRRAGSPLLVDGFGSPGAIMFIPDKSIISKAVIQYVIKEGLLNNIPVIGYNRFFHESGAALSFLIDYHRVGRQVADQVERLVAGERCAGLAAPFFETVVNDETWRIMGGGRSAPPGGKDD